MSSFVSSLLVLLLLSSFNGSSSSFLNTARGRIYKDLNTNDILISLSSNGLDQPELLNWASPSSSLSCVKSNPTLPIYKKLVPDLLIEKNVVFSCYLMNDFVFTSCPSLLQANERSPKFVLDASNDVSKRDGSAVGSTSLQCDDLIQFQYNAPIISEGRPMFFYLAGAGAGIIMMLAYFRWVARRLKMKVKAIAKRRRSRSKGRLLKVKDVKRTYRNRGSSSFSAAYEDYDRSGSRSRSRSASAFRTGSTSLRSCSRGRTHSSAYSRDISQRYGDDCSDDDIVYGVADYSDERSVDSFDHSKKSIDVVNEDDLNMMNTDLLRQLESSSAPYLRGRSRSRHRG